MQPRVAEPNQEILDRKEARQSREVKRTVTTKTAEPSTDAPMTRMSRHRRK